MGISIAKRPPTVGYFPISQPNPKHPKGWFLGMPGIVTAAAMIASYAVMVYVVERVL